MQRITLITSLFICLLFQVGQTQVNTAFSVDTFELCAPGVVQFTDLSTSTAGPIVQWTWYVNASPFSNLQNPGYLFNNPGVYDICLQVTDNLGNTDSVCFSNFIYAYNGPTANFSADITSGCRPLKVNFTDLSTPGDAPIDAWQWDYGDGFVDSVACHLYNTVGNFDVTLVISDSNGCTSSLLQSNLIQVYDSVTAAISHNAHQLQCGLPASVTFNGLSNGPSLTYSWDLGDNSPIVVQQNVAHNYTAAGCFSPTLTVSNGVCAATATVASCITVSDVPVASFTIADPTNCEIPFTPNIQNTSTGMTSWNWDFGDGNSSSTMFHPNHTYNTYRPEDSVYYQDGVFPVILTVTNAAGCVAADTQLIYISDQIVSLTRPAILCAPDTFTLSALTANISGAFYPTNFAWDVEDSLYTSGSIAVTYYSDSGYYNAQVIVTDNIGCMDTANLVNIVGILPIIDSITTDTNFVCRMTGINFMGFGSSYIDDWSWTFDDTSNAYGQSVLHHFTDTGFISGFLFAGFRNCVTTVELDTYYIHPPIALFSPRIICDSLEVEFLDKSIGAHHYYWDFGDTLSVTDTSTLSDPSYLYPGNGTYVVTQIVYNDSTNCVDTFRMTITLENAIADFSISDSVCVTAFITPDNNSQNVNTNHWVAGGSLPFTAVAEEPLFVFRDPGIFEVKLTVYDINGCPDTLVKTIHVAGINDQISHVPDPACRGGTVTFVDSSVGVLSPIVNWQWGNLSTLSSTSQIYPFPGPQIMTLSVTNDWGCSFPLVDSVNVGGLFMNFNSTRDVCLGNNLTLIAITSSPANADAFEPFTFIWDFGDGVIDTTLSSVHSHLYQSAGVFDVCLSIVDSIGCVTTLCRPNWVEVHDPTVLFTADTFFSSCPPLQVQFSNLSLSGSQWNWDFGDGSVSTTENPTHIYSTPGFYNVALEVIAFPGCLHRDTFYQMIQITGPTGDFVMPPAVGCAPYTAQFAGFGSNIASYTWLFGDGNTLTHFNSGGTDTTYYTYDSVGVFVPQLFIEDSMGCRITKEHDTIIILAPPAPAFDSDTLICQLDSVHYQLLTPLSAGVTVEWSFDGGFPNYSTQANPTIYYPDTGQFDVQLIITKDGCSDTLLQANYIQIKSRPNAHFGSTIGDTCVPVFVAFTDSSTSEQGFIQQWFWDLDNNTTATSPDTSLWYAMADTFHIQLIVENNFGCRDTATASFNTFPTPNVDAGSYPPVCFGDTIQLNGSGNAAFSWSSSAWLSDTTIANPLTVLDSSQQYILTVYNAFGCRVLDTTTIVALSYINVEAGDSAVICLGDSVLLQASGNTSSFDWGANASLSCQFCSNPIATPSNTTIYYLQDSLGASCANNDSVIVYVRPLPNAQILADSSICEGDTLQLQAFGGQSYLWLTGSNLSNDSISNPIATPINASTYTVAVIDSNNCRDSISLTVAIRSTNFTPLGDLTICLGDSVQLQLSNATNPTWLGNQLSCNTCSNPTATPTDSSLYWVQYYNPDHCPIEDSLNIHVLDLTALQALTSDSICLGDSVQLNVLGSQGVPVVWSPNYALSNNNITNPLAYPSIDTTYVVQISEGQCQASDSIQIHLRPLADIQAIDVAYCIGDTAQLIASGNVATYLWTPALYLSDSSIFNPIVTAINNQQYQVVGGNLCGLDTAYANVQVHPYPSMQLDSSVSSLLGNTIVLQTNALPSYTFTWSPSDDLSCTNCPNPSWLVSGNQTFHVTITNNFGCHISDSISIFSFMDCTPDIVFVPNAFSPDSDGHNDLLYVRSGIIQEIVRFQIYSRWGQLLFESTDMQEGWDGSYQGKALPPDVFGYYVIFRCPNTGEEILKKGNVTILR